MTDDAVLPKEGDLKVWYVPQFPMEPYEVVIVRLAGEYDAAYMKRAAFTIEIIVGLSIFEFENNVKPDYSDAAGIVRFEDGEWCDVDDEEWDV